VHEYLRRLGLAQKKGILDAGTVAHANVMHDDTCGIYRDRECNCDPDITIETDKGKVSVGRDGTVRAVS
jgi:hypothetical protein